MAVQRKQITAEKLDGDGVQIRRVRSLCSDFPVVSERISHGAPTFFGAKRVFAMFVDNHHGDGRLAVYLPVPEGEQPTMIEENPEAFFHPPYVGVKGWVGIQLHNIGDEELAVLLQQGWRLTNKK